MRYVALDVETTGTDILCDDVVQLAAIAFDDTGTELDSIDVLCKTSRSLDTATKVHGITHEMLDAKGISPQNAASRLRELCRYDANLVGHNIIGFDLPLTWNWIKRNDGSNFVLPSVNTVYDTMMSARSLLCTGKWLKNSELAEALGHTFYANMLHDAMYDLQLTVTNFLKMQQLQMYNAVAQEALSIARSKLPTILARRPKR